MRPLTVLLALVLATSTTIAAPAKRGSTTPPQEPPKRTLEATDLGGLTFRSVGPANMGGRVSTLAWVPGSRTSFYAGFGTGGVFRTENLGMTWTPLFDDQPVLSIGAIAVADRPAAGASPQPLERRGEIVWVGTGEGNNRNSSSWGNGVYRSTDGGATFRHVGLEATRDIPALALDPRDPDVAYVAALGRLWGPNPERGVFKTSDGGTSWRHVLKVDVDVGACAVEVDPGNPDTVYAGLYARRRTPWSYTGISAKGGVFRSDDGGKTWKKLARGLPARTGNIGLAIFPADPKIVYAVVESDEGGSGRDPFDDRSGSGGVFRSEDRGENWTRVSDLNFRPFYFSKIAVDPKDANRVYLPGWDVAISDDGGRNFRRSGSEFVHVDHHAFVIHPDDPALILDGNDGGVYVSVDRAKSWDRRDNLAVGQFYRVAVDASDPYRIAGGLQDNGSWVGPSETIFRTEDESKDGILNRDWSEIFGWDGFTVQFDPEDPDQFYATGQGAVLLRVNLRTATVRFLQPSPREGQERFRFNWNSPYFVSPHDPSVLYLGGNRVFRLTSRGDAWEAVSPDLSRREVDKIQTVGSEAETHGTVTALQESALVKGLLWAGTDDGRVHVTEDGGATWRDVTPKEVGGLYVSSIVVSRHERARAYLSVDGHRTDVDRPIVLTTDDLGRSWRPIVAGLPEDAPVKMLHEDPRSPNVLYAGTEFGAHVSVDRGRRWVRLNGTSLPPAPVDDLVVHPREGDLVVATHGRSIWILDDAWFFAQLTPELMDKPLAGLQGPPARPRRFLGRAYGSGAAIFRGKNPPPGAAIQFWVKDRVSEPVSISIADASGFVLRTLTATSRSGVNRVVWDLTAEPKHVVKTIDAERFGQTQFVAPGEYKATITLGTEKTETKVVVLPSP